MENFQPVLMKIYFHAGLKDLAVTAGYKEENLTALELCSNWKHTHVFLLEVLEAVYLHASGYLLCNQSTKSVPTIIC